jgi:hypothetical protein
MDSNITTITGSIVLTSLQKDVLVGTMLGDACAERVKPTHNTRIRYDQSYPDHEGYLNHLYEVLKPLTASGPKIITRKADKRTGLAYQSIAFKTRMLPSLNYYHELFYSLTDATQVSGIKYKKLVPACIGDLLTPAALAY